MGGLLPSLCLGYRGGRRLRYVLVQPDQREPRLRQRESPPARPPRTDGLRRVGHVGLVGSTRKRGRCKRHRPEHAWKSPSLRSGPDRRRGFSRSHIAHMPRPSFTPIFTPHLPLFISPDSPSQFDNQGSSRARSSSRRWRPACLVRCFVSERSTTRHRAGWDVRAPSTSTKPWRPRAITRSSHAKQPPPRSFCSRMSQRAPTQSHRCRSRPPRLFARVAASSLSSAVPATPHLSQTRVSLILTLILILTPLFPHVTTPFSPHATPYFSHMPRPVFTAHHTAVFPCNTRRFSSS